MSAMRANNGIQVFKKNRTFVKEGFFAKRRKDRDDVDVAVSKDPQQTSLYRADGSNNKIFITERDTLGTLTSFGDRGRQPGQFYAVHNIATNSKAIFLQWRLSTDSASRSSCPEAGNRHQTGSGVVWPKTAKARCDDSGGWQRSQLPRVAIRRRSLLQCVFVSEDLHGFRPAVSLRAISPFVEVPPRMGHRRAPAAGPARCG